MEKLAIKDIKLRTFIAEGDSRNDLAAHVYDVTYGLVKTGIDNLVVIDDSIVRGTTLRQSIIRILDRLKPKKIVIVSSSPQVRYPDYYGIDMSRMGEFAAFRAAMALLKERGMCKVIDDVYRKWESTSPKSTVHSPTRKFHGKLPICSPPKEQMLKLRLSTSLSTVSTSLSPTTPAIGTSQAIIPLPVAIKW